MSNTTQKRLIILLLGIATITAGVFSWRAGQLSSTAAFDDRQSVGETIKQEEQQIESGLKAVGNIRSYVQYVADYAEAAARDDRGEEYEQQDATALAESANDEAAGTRDAATIRASAAGLFGQTSIYADLDGANTTPRPFDFDVQYAEIQSEIESAITAPGRLDPDRWAEEADEIRIRVRGLRVAALVVILSVVMMTYAEMTERRSGRYIGTGIGLTVFVATTWVTMATVW